MKSHKNKILLIAIAIAIVVIIGALWYFSAPKPAAVSVNASDQFAQCLAQKGFVMYGLYSCPHCQAEKALFGDSFQYVKYVECSTDPNKCTADNVDAVPTWIEPDGTRFVGTQTLAQLSQASGCPLPQ
jgi:hypothetical protein